MKPIELKIKGLNSFNEEQVIDFEKLTERGLFGIFGPTGSGKTTVLDGITLALYGDISRKSNNFINTNCDTLSLSFKFQISGGKPKVYIVSREFKRDKKTGNPQSGKCKLIEVIDGERVILAEKVKEVTNGCRDIIGLSLEDFTRTVVLPQGKFSEFLKLEGKSRREMLERLFNLQVYGDDLARKLGSKISKEKVDYNVLLGEFKGYEEITNEALNIKENELEEYVNSFKKENNELKEIEKVFEETQELWNLKQEFSNYKIEEENLKREDESIASYKKKIALGESALNVIPYVKVFEETVNKIKVAKSEEISLKDKNEKLSLEKDENEKLWNLWRKQKDDEIPSLRAQEEKINSAIEEKNILDKIVKLIEKLNEDIEKLEETQKSSNEKIVTLEERIKKGTNKINDTEVKIEGLKVDSVLKAKVNEGILLSEKATGLKKIVDETREKIQQFKNAIESGNKNLTLKTEEFELKKMSLAQNRKNLEELLKHKPGEKEDLVVLQSNILECKEKWNRHNTATKAVEEFKEKIIELEALLKVGSEEKINIEKKIEDLKISLNEIQVENLAHRLRENLKAGEACPVCGSTSHSIDNIKNVNSLDISELEKELKSKEEALKNVESSINLNEANIKFLKERIEENDKEIDDVGEAFKAHPIEVLEKEYDVLKAAIDKFEKEKEKLEGLDKSLSELVISLEGVINTEKVLMEQNKKQLCELEKKFNEDFLVLEELEIEINKLKDDTKVDDFKAKQKEISSVEEEREKLQTNLNEYRKLLERIKDARDKEKAKFESIKNELTKNKSILSENEKNGSERCSSIKNKVGEIDNLEEALNKVISKINTIELEFSKLEKEKVSIEERFKECNKALSEVSGRVSDLEKRKLSEEKNLELALKEEGFENSTMVKESLISKDEIYNLKELVEEHNNKLAKLNGAMESILSKINGREITEECWINIQNEKREKESKVKEINERRIRVEEEVNLIRKKLKELDDLVEKRAKMEHRLSLLSDLEKLFKGKKFVEFVAGERLKYVSIEASKRLKEISSGNYGLEVDEDSRFIIRDYKNGGVARDASTLSGGETFLTSLALALALSNEIQLKGTAPLELFFLDEGFGTLDDNLLDIVMSSLERIHNDKLKVGIISHVEAIKNRVPVKLILTPSEAGKGGSKVRIEKS